MNKKVLYSFIFLALELVQGLFLRGNLISNYMELENSLNICINKEEVTLSHTGKLNSKNVSQLSLDTENTISIKLDL